MFDWLYKRIGNAVIDQIETWLQDPKNIEELTRLTDALVDRQMKRIMSGLGGAQKGTVAAAPGQGFNVGSLLTGRGGVSSKAVLGLILQKFLGGQAQGEQRQGALP